MKILEEGNGPKGLTTTEIVEHYEGADFLLIPLSLVSYRLARWYHYERLKLSISQTLEIGDRCRISSESKRVFYDDTNLSGMDDSDIESYKVYERCRSYDLSSKAFGLEDVGKALEYSLKTVHAIQVGVSVEKFISQKVS